MSASLPGYPWKSGRPSGLRHSSLGQGRSKKAGIAPRGSVKEICTAPDSGALGVYGCGAGVMGTGDAAQPASARIMMLGQRISWHSTTPGGTFVVEMIGVDEGS